MRYIVVFITMIAIALCCSCGGGGPSTSTSLQDKVSTPVPTPGEAQGTYTGTYSYGLAFYSIILPNDMFYSIEGNAGPDGAMTHVFRLGSGPGTSTSGTYTASLYFSVFDGGFSSNLQAKYVPATSLTGSISNGTFTATALPLAQLDFNTPANMSHITGSWSGLFVEDMLEGPATGAITISSTGQITSAGSDCSFSGTVTPDANKNFFNVSITLGPAPCSPASQTISGIAVEMLLPNGTTRQLLIVTRQSTFGFAAVR